METEEKIGSLWPQTFTASAVAVLLSLFGYAMTAAGLSGYVFLLVPFCTGLAIAYMSEGRLIVAVAATTSLLLSLSTLLWAGFEGIGCVLMAFPILFIGMSLGGLVGFLLLRSFNGKGGNVMVLAFCVGVLSLVGWTKPQMGDLELVVVETSMDFYAPMAEVWQAVREPDALDGDDRALRFLGLPVPQSCTLSEDGSRVCYFEDGEMRQRVTAEEYGKVFAVEIVESLHVREWLTFIDAGYAFEQHDGFVRVTRTDRIESRLRPRWYWPWFESRCVELEHDFVLGCMKAQVEG